MFVCVTTLRDGCDLVVKWLRDGWRPGRSKSTPAQSQVWECVSCLFFIDGLSKKNALNKILELEKTSNMGSANDAFALRPSQESLQSDRADDAHEFGGRSFAEVKGLADDG